MFEYMKSVYDVNPEMGRELFILNQNSLPKIATPAPNIETRSKKKKRRK